MEEKLSTHTGYTYEQFTDFCENMDHLSMLPIPLTREARHRAVAGSMAHCTLANALCDFTGLDPKKNKVEVTAKEIRFVLNPDREGGDAVRYILIPEFTGAKHIKQLDELGEAEGDKGKPWKPIIVSARYYDHRILHPRPGGQGELSSKAREKARKAAESKVKVKAKTGPNDDANGAKAPPAKPGPKPRSVPRAKRRTSRWARKPEPIAA